MDNANINISEKIPNSSQQQIIDNFSDNILLFASAGTGKTFTMAKKVQKALDLNYCKSDEVLAITFTIKAANELREDIGTYNNQKEITVKTIHSFCLSLLREERKIQNNEQFNISVKDEVDCNEIIKDILSNEIFPLYSNCQTDKVEKISLNTFTNFISLLKHQRELLNYFSNDTTLDYQKTFDYLLTSRENELNQTMQYFNANISRLVLDNTFKNCMKKYCGILLEKYIDELKTLSSVDFDDLIIEAEHLLTNEEVYQRWHNRYKLIIIDEAQDTSVFEYKMLRNIFNGQVIMCGDFFQTIYEWRGSCPQIIFDTFIKDYNAKIMHLNTNYRSTKLLSQAGFGYLKNTYKNEIEKYLPKDLLIKSTTDGEKIINGIFNTLKDEAEWIFNTISKLNVKKYSEICVVGRSKKIIEQMQKELNIISNNNSSDIKFFSINKDFNFFKRPVAKDILAYLSILINVNDLYNFERISSKYLSNINKSTLKIIRQQSGIGINLCSLLNKDTYQFNDCYYSLIKAAKSESLVVYDLETTGLDRAKDEIIQIAGEKINLKGEVIDKINLFVTPSVEINSSAEKTHGISKQRLIELNAVDIKTALTQFCKFSNDCVIVGHNNSQFDNLILNRQLKENHIIYNFNDTYDNLIISKIFLPSLNNYKLSTLCSYFNINNEKAHDAFFDVEATKNILIKLINNYIIPTSTNRILFFEKYSNLFSKFFKAYCEFKNILENDSLINLYNKIISDCYIEKIYKEDDDIITISDFRTLFKNTTETNNFKFIQSLLDDSSLSGGQIDIIIERLNKIPIVTVHQTKGCEFNYLFIICASENNFPSFMSVKQGNIEEEKRLFYVAITRPKKQLFITSHRYNNSSSNYSMAESPFISLIPKDNIKLIIQHQN